LPGTPGRSAAVAMPVESASKSVADAIRKTEAKFIEISPKAPVAFPRPFFVNY
jgi:hypothetical protein